MIEKQKKGLEKLLEYGEKTYECKDYFHIEIEDTYDEEEIRSIGKEFFGGCEIVEEVYDGYGEGCVNVWEFPLTEKGLAELG